MAALPRFGMFGGLFLLTVACDSAPETSSPARADEPARPQPVVAASASTPVTSAATTSGPALSVSVKGAPSAAQCLSEKEISEESRLRGRVPPYHLAVVGVDANDTLNVRSQPSAKAKVVTQLRPNQRDVIPSGKVCRVGPSFWLEISAGASKGWANSRYLWSTTAPEDHTKAMAAHVANAKPASPSTLMKALAAKIKEGEKDAEAPCSVRALGISQSRGTARSAIYMRCRDDDSVGGEQIWLDLARVDNHWTITKANRVHLCLRGHVDDKVCL